MMVFQSNEGVSQPIYATDQLFDFAAVLRVAEISWFLQRSDLSLKCARAARFLRGGQSPCFRGHPCIPLSRRPAL